MTPEIGKAFEQAADGLLGMMAVEVTRAKVGVLNAIPKHVVSGGEHGSSYGEEALLAPRRVGP